MHGSHQPKGLHDAAEGRLTVGNMLLTTSGRGRPAPHERPQRPALPHAVHHGDGGAADDDRKLVEIFGEIEWLIPGAFSRLFASLFSGVKRLSALPAIAPHAGSTTSYRRRRRHTSLVTHHPAGRPKRQRLPLHQSPVCHKAYGLPHPATRPDDRGILQGQK